MPGFEGGAMKYLNMKPMSEYWHHDASAVFPTFRRPLLSTSSTQSDYSVAPDGA